MNKAIDNMIFYIDRKQYDKMLKMLFEKYQVDIHTLDKDERQILWYMVAYIDFTNPGKIEKYLDCIKFLIRQGADINHIDKFGNSVLHVAARNNIPSLVQVLINEGANIDVINEDDMTPLDFAMGFFEDDKPEAVSVLLKSGANPYRKASSKDKEFQTPADFAQNISDATCKNLKTVFFESIK